MTEHGNYKVLVRLHLMGPSGRTFTWSFTCWPSTQVVHTLMMPLGPIRWTFQVNQRVLGILSLFCQIQEINVPLASTANKNSLVLKNSHAFLGVTTESSGAAFQANLCLDYSGNHVLKPFLLTPVRSKSFFLAGLCPLLQIDNILAIGGPSRNPMKYCQV